MLKDIMVLNIKRLKGLVRSELFDTLERMLTPISYKDKFSEVMSSCWW